MYRYYFKISGNVNLNTYTLVKYIYFFPADGKFHVHLISNYVHRNGVN